MRSALNNFDEDARNSLSQHPTCMGCEEHELAKVKEVLEEADENALVIVGVHAPPINPSGDEWPHYFRETEHPTADERETLGYLMRRDPKAFRPEDRGDPAPDPSQIHPDWI